VTRPIHSVIKTIAFVTVCLFLPSFTQVACNQATHIRTADASPSAGEDHLTTEMPPPKLPDSEILSPYFFGLSKEEADDPMAWHGGIQSNDAYLGYLVCQDMRKKIANLYRGETFNKDDPKAAGLSADITILAGDYLAILVDTRWNESAKIDSLLGRMVKDVRDDLNPVKVEKQDLLVRLDFYQEVFRQVLRRYAPYSKQSHWFGFKSDGDAKAREALIDIYYPYMKQPVRVSLNKEDREDVFDLLNPAALVGSVGDDQKYLTSAVKRGVVNVGSASEPIVVPAAVETQLSNRELLALRNSCYFLSTTLNLNGLTLSEGASLASFIMNKREAALPLAPPNSPTEVKEALSWWLYWRLTPAERKAWRKYRRNVNKAAEQIDGILRSRDVRR
jgi:hypothetical protein